MVKTRTSVKGNKEVIEILDSGDEDELEEHRGKGKQKECVKYGDMVKVCFPSVSEEAV